MKEESKKIKLRVVFMGTSHLSAAILQKLIQEEYNVVGVFTKPDTKVGRKQLEESPLVKKLAQEKSIPVFQPEKFKAEAIEELTNLKPDMVIVAAYGKILPKAALEIPGFGCINVHVSLLPKYRGPSPVQNALFNGETETGVTIMLMDEGIDSGDILSQRKIQIEKEDNAQTLMDKLSLLGGELLIETISPWLERKIEPIKQDHSAATFCQLIEREDGKVLWTNDAKSIINQYRALTPWPGVFTFWKNNSSFVRIKLNKIEMLEQKDLPKLKEGEVFLLENEVAVQTADGIIILKEIQREGKKTVEAKSFINGYTDFIGSILN
jgi:methionyl-tRNA formyltransferase